MPITQQKEHKISQTSEHAYFSSNLPLPVSPSENKALQDESAYANESVKHIILKSCTSNV